MFYAPRRFVVMILLSAASLPAQTSAPARPAPPPWQLSPEECERINRLNREDHAAMLAKLGITSLRPGRSEHGARNRQSRQLR
jgi:hypothetical protein